jgi:MYXO-CTERM domain-containing protein
MNQSTRALSAIIAMSITAAASAGFINADIPSWRGDAGTSYYGWESFSDAGGGINWPDSGDSGATLMNFASGAFITGGGNMYGMEGLNIHVYGSGDIDQAVLNIATMGTQFDYASITLAVDAGQGYTYFNAAETAINYQESLGEQGDLINASLHFDLSSFDAEILEWGFILSGPMPHISLDAVMVDIATTAVPAPATIALLALAGIARRRRRH